MGERAKFPILALDGIIGVEIAELTFVSAGMVELLNFVMGVWAIHVAVPMMVAKNMAVLVEVGPTFITIAVIVNACFSFMVVMVFSLASFFRTRFDFEMI
jgi:hypothetical protein